MKLLTSIKVYVFVPTYKYAGGQVIVPHTSEKLKEYLKNKNTWKFAGTSYVTEVYFKRFSKDGIIDLSWSE